VKASKYFVITFCLVLLCTLAMPGIAMADEQDKATQLTFSEPVEVPGQVLPAGTYWFVLADSDSDRNAVQIWNADRMHLVTTILAIPDYRLKARGKTVINFEERAADQPEAIHSWFYPGDNYGEEFVYPKARAMQLAKQTNRPVLSMRDDRASNTAPITQKAVNAVSPSGEEIEIADIVSSQPVDIPEEEETASSLPTTASLLPLLGLLGLLSLAAGVGLRALTERLS
jgi:hypothetical protein